MLQTIEFWLFIQFANLCLSTGKLKQFIESATTKDTDLFLSLCSFSAVDSFICLLS